MRLPQGFRCGGVHCGLKADEQLDMGMLTSDRDCVAAAVFTQCVVAAAPVVLGRELMAGGKPLRALLINSKNANAVTGEQGLKDARETSSLVAQQLGLSGPEQVFVMSTGVIGQPMPMHCIRRGIPLAAKSQSVDGAEAFSRSIMTTDTHPKVAEARVGEATIVGFAKGAGMIHPDMATMLAAIITDAEFSAAHLKTIVDRVTERTFNCISVDGDTSTNDTFLVMANGFAGKVEPVEFEAALLEVAGSLARQIAFDGEGASHQVTIHIEGARDFQQARQVGRTIATSPLVKTAVYGRDANWGRILAAAGRAGVDFEPAATQLWIQGTQYLRDGMPLPVDEEKATASLGEKAVEIRLRLGDGSGKATVWTCDLTPGYISVNADYRT